MGEGVEQRQEVFHRIEPRDGGDDKCAVVEAEQHPRPAPIERRRRGRRLDAVVNHANPLARKPRRDHVVAQLVRDGDDAAVEPREQRVHQAPLP